LFPHLTVYTDGGSVIHIRKIAIFGAAGAIGRPLAFELERRGIAFRAVGRSRGKLEKAFGACTQAEIFDADVADLRSAGAAAREVDTIVYCVGLPYPSHNRHPAMMRTVIEAAAAMHVERLILISSVYAYGVPRTSRVAETHPRQPQTRKGQFRKEQEDLVLEAHKSGRIRGMVLRLPDFYGPTADQGYAPLVFTAALAGKTANWVGPVTAQHEFVYVPDVAPVLADLANLPECFGEAWNYGGPGPIAPVDFITRVYRAAGRDPKYRSVGRGMLKILGWFNADLREVPEMMYLQETPVILDDSKLLAKLGNVHKTPYDEGIRKTMEFLRGASGGPGV
jgi:nucleoside-diphosphate-sugar epimerase